LVFHDSKYGNRIYVDAIGCDRICMDTNMNNFSFRIEIIGKSYALFSSNRVMLEASEIREVER
jgi:hypothetical protein